MKKTEAIFIVGNSRSGTTMLSQILGNNEEVFSFNELHFFEQLVSNKDVNSELTNKESIKLFAKLIEIQREGYLHTGTFSKYIPEASQQIRNRNFTAIDIYLNFLRYETSFQNKLYPCEQTPRNLFYLDHIFKFIPNVKVVNIVRDPRAVLNSQKGKWKLKWLGLDKIPYKEAIRTKINYHPITMSKIWVGGIRMGLRYKQNPNVKTIKFEDLVHNPKVIMKEVCEFIGIKFSLQMLNIPRWGSSREKAKETNRGIDATVINAWVNNYITNEEISICENIAFKEMKLLNYKGSKVKINYNKLMIIYLVFPIHLFLALMFNLRRTKDLMDAIKRRFLNS